MPLKFYQTVGSIEGANSRLVDRCSTRRCAACSARRRLTHVVRDERAQLMARVREQLEPEAQAFGIAVVDVRIRRADLPEQNSQAVYQRMQTERQREAAEFRAQGSQRAQEIRARADRDVTVLVAEATSKAEQIRGEGDAERNRIFAEAFGQDPDFFAFYRSMQAYEAGLRHNDTRMLLKPDSDFFRYFVDPSGKRRGRRAQTVAVSSPAAIGRTRDDVIAGGAPSRRRRWSREDVRFRRGGRPRARDRGADLRGLSAGGEAAGGAMRWRAPDGSLRIAGVVVGACSACVADLGWCAAE